MVSMQESSNSSHAESQNSTAVLLKISCTTTNIVVKCQKVLAFPVPVIRLISEKTGAQQAPVFMLDLLVSLSISRLHRYFR